jgi:hypothetical protein
LRRRDSALRAVKKTQLTSGKLSGCLLNAFLLGKYRYIYRYIRGSALRAVTKTQLTSGKLSGCLLNALLLASFSTNVVNVIYIYIYIYVYISIYMYIYIYCAEGMTGPWQFGPQTAISISCMRRTRRSRYSVFLLYWYKSTNTDAARREAKQGADQNLWSRGRILDEQIPEENVAEDL